MFLPTWLYTFTNVFLISSKNPLWLKVAFKKSSKHSPHASPGISENILQVYSTILFIKYSTPKKIKQKSFWMDWIPPHSWGFFFWRLPLNESVICWLSKSQYLFYSFIFTPTNGLDQKGRRKHKNKFLDTLISFFSQYTFRG